MIEPELAEKFIEQLTQYTEYNINIMDESGIIIASRDPKRVGTYHEAAALVVSGGSDMLAVEDDTTYSGVLPGINMAIRHEGRREGVVGVTGDPSRIREVALITRLALEAMLKYEKQQEKIRQRRNRKDHFITLLTRTEHADPAEIRSMAAQLGYEESPVRVPILCRIDNVDNNTGRSDSGSVGKEKAGDTYRSNRDSGDKPCTPADLLERLHQGSRHKKQDISCLLDDSHVLIFKTLQWGENHSLPDYRGRIMDYLYDTVRWAQKEGVPAVFFAGTLQQSFSQYYYSYRHCKWMEKHISGARPVNSMKAGTGPAPTLRSKGRGTGINMVPAAGAAMKNSTGSWDDAFRNVFFFHDFTREYLRSLLPRQELQRIFQVYSKNLDEAAKGQFMETARALMDANYNLAEAARNLFLHKNTMAYRYNKVKDLLGIDPLVSSSDRGFLEMLYQYLL